MAKKTKTTPTTVVQRPPRLAVIDMMIGIAMILVVLGHQTVPFSPRWYDEGLHEWIYMFHMELFMFLSAFLIRYSYRGVKSVGDYGRYIWRKFVKFFVPFLVIGLVVSLVLTRMSICPNSLRMSATIFSTSSSLVTSQI